MSITQTVADALRKLQRIKELNKCDIGASVHFDPPVHKQPFYARGNYDMSGLQVTENVVKRIVTLPMYPSITVEQLDHMINSVKDALIQNRAL